MKKVQPNDLRHLQVIAADLLAHYGLSAISRYELSMRLFRHLRTHAPEIALSRDIFERVCSELVQVRLLNPVEPISKSRAYVLFGAQKAAAGELFCCIDPFAYVSHLSALEYHGLTDRFSRMLYITRPRLPNWKSFALDRMKHELGEGYENYQRSGLESLRAPCVASLGGSAVHITTHTHLGAFRNVAGSALRVSTLGRVFLEMLRNPDLCGGMQHVIDIYKNHAGRYLRLIVQDIDRHGLVIDKVRAGFLLAEVCGFEDPMILGWQQFASRGGSRKLDPEGEYASEFSERWMLSINVPSLSRVVNVRTG